MTIIWRITLTPGASAGTITIVCWWCALELFGSLLPRTRWTFVLGSPAPLMYLKEKDCSSVGNSWCWQTDEPLVAIDHNFVALLSDRGADVRGIGRCD